ncbi:hypothetical protein OAB00_02835 [Akkermansiaceae bacterium]|nr:hypothetical protein [Akkermansiaceae bacterium]
MDSGKVCIEIEHSDLSLLEVAIEERMKTWVRTRDFWLGYDESTETFMAELTDGDIEEATSLCEAEHMVQIWERFSETISNQIVT